MWRSGGLVAPGRLLFLLHPTSGSSAKENILPALPRHRAGMAIRLENSLGFPAGDLYAREGLECK